MDGLLLNGKSPGKINSAKNRFELEKGDSDSEIMATAIGQGNTAVTPLQLVTYAATLANLGRRPALHYARQAVADGTVVWKHEESFTTVEGGEAHLEYGAVRKRYKNQVALS